MTAVKVASGESYTYKIKWINLILLVYFHIASYQNFFATKLWSSHIILMIGIMSTGLGISFGAHRYFTHKSFKANLPLRILMLVCQTFSGQESLILWARNHRIHHKFVDTDADPHNSKRGFFFSHVGWLLVKKHPDVIAAGKKIDISDLTSDPMLTFQHKLVFKSQQVAESKKLWLYFWQILHSVVSSDYINRSCFNYGVFRWIVQHGLEP